MSYQTKRKIVIVALVTLTIWPLVHHVAVRRLDLNPWHWFGWSMYATPPRRIRAHAISVPDGGKLDLQGLSRAEATRVLRAYDEFSTRRIEYGDRVEPDEFARALFRAYPRERQIKISVQRLGLDRATGMVVEKRITDPPYVYSRSDMFGPEWEQK